MLSLGFSRALTGSGFEHRATILPDAQVVYRLADGSGHVTLPLAEWQALGERFQTAVKPVARRAVIASICLLPGLVLYVLVMAILGSALGLRLPGSLAAIGLLAGLAFGPTTIYLWQSHRVKRIGQALEAELVRCSRAPPPPPVPSRPPRWLQVAGMLLIGPGLIVALVGELGGPDMFRNTPLSGTRLGPIGYAGFAVLAALVVHRLRARRHACPDATEVRPDGRRIDVVARARRRCG